jgi:Flp pilus assembly protein TadB
MRKPPITVNCDCGESKQVAYGERWQCERCRRSWDTGQIPEEEYAGLLRRMRRYRLEAVCLAVVLAAILVPLIVLVSASYIFLTPVVAAAWLFLYLPRWRRKVRDAARNAPRWQLRPE